MRYLVGLSAKNILGLFAACAAIVTARSATEIGPWKPLFKGIDYSVSTNIPGSGDFLYLQVVHALRVDLGDPDISFLTTPRITNNYTANVREIAAYTPSDFLRNHQLQAVINANFFSEGSYYLPAGTPMDLFGLEVSEGEVVSPPSFGHSAVLQLDVNKLATILHTNWPAASTEGVHTAIAGNAALVYHGVNIRPRSSLNDLDPRTAFGLSEDRRYLYIAALDGRQPEYSQGASLYETAGWMLLLGAYDAINVDGGGSTTLVMQDITGNPLRLNSSSAVADSGRERTVGSHFGIYAKPLEGFINDIVVTPDDTTAVITWTTIEPALSEVRYGTSTSLGSSSGSTDTKITQHQVTLSSLDRDTGYYYKIIAQTDSAEHSSPLLYFKTISHLTTNEVFALTKEWKYSPTFISGWENTDFTEAGWSGPGPALLWVDTRTSGPNPSVQPRNTELPANGAYPYITYYFRTKFNLAAMPPGSSLHFRGFIDDGAVFYLNGAKIFPLRMPAAFNSTTLANGFPCAGDATCFDEFIIPVSLLPSVVAGENLLAVEVHNYNARSNDITFGLELSRLDPVTDEPAPKLTIAQTEQGLVIGWDGTGFRLQSSATVDGDWGDVGSASNPMTIQPEGESRFYRLVK
jgi:hypothetical protein